MNRSHTANLQSDSFSRWPPSWVTALGTPVWISSPAGEVAYLNRHAEHLFGLRAEDCIGQPCHQVIGAQDESGHPFCRQECRLRSLAATSREIPPVLVQRAGKWLQIIAIPVRAPDGSGPWLIHCSLAADLAHRLQTYMQKVAGRGHDTAEDTQLTARESEVLQRLSNDETLHGIADALGVRYVTVRNHVQHILAKLAVHSIEEAIAIHLLHGDDQYEVR